jgi:hypothetical protein
MIVEQTLKKSPLFSLPLSCLSSFLLTSTTSHKKRTIFFFKSVLENTRNENLNLLVGIKSLNLFLYSSLKKKLPVRTKILLVFGLGPEDLFFSPHDELVGLKNRILNSPLFSLPLSSYWSFPLTSTLFTQKKKVEEECVHRAQCPPFTTKVNQGITQEL